MTLRSQFGVTGTNNPDKQVSVTSFNNLLTAIDTDIAAAAATGTAHTFKAFDENGDRIDIPFVTPQMFGAVGDGVTDDSAAFVAAIAYLKTIAVNPVMTWYKGSTRLHVPPGHYYLGTTTLDLTHTLVIEGEDGGFHGGHSTLLRWAPGTTGIRVQAYNTTGAEGTTDGSGGGGDGSVIRNLHLQGGLQENATEGEHHGIHARARCQIYNVAFSYWQGDGIHIRADVAAPYLGEASMVQIRTSQMTRVRNGVYIEGGDANIVNAASIDVVYARRWGVWDSSFLGNRFESCHASHCGGILSPGYTPSTVSHNGNWYSVVHGQEANASTNAPSGTTADTDYWYYVSAGDPSPDNFNVPAWVSGITVRSGGPYLVDGSSATTTLDDCYSEGGQGPTQLPYLGLSIGGMQGARIVGARIAAQGGVPVSDRLLGAIGSKDANLKTYIGSGESSTDGIFSHHNSTAIGGAGALALGFPSYSPNVLHWTNWRSSYTNDLVPYQISMNGASAADAPWGTNRMNFPLGFGLGGKKMETGTAAPASGTYNRGDVVWNSAPSAGGTIGWVCTTAGTPGAWVPFGIAGGVQAETQADSVAADVATLKTDFNALLAKLKAAKLMA